jgi:amidase
MTMEDFGAYDAVGLAELVRRRAVSATELVDTAIARAERVNERLNAIVTPLYDRARAEAAALDETVTTEVAAPFRGVPFLLKDLYAPLAGAPMAAGSKLLKDFRAPHDSTLVARFRAAGLIVFGKTATPELGITPYTEPALHGPTHNPWDLALTPGGSSGGSAAAVAAGIVPAAHGNDGGGSLRIPASCCGLFGLKPTRGRTPVGPDLTHLWHGYAIDHVLTRSVRDSAAMLDAIAGPEPTSPYWAPPAARPFSTEVGTAPRRLRIALSKRPQVGPEIAGVAPHPDCLAAADDAAHLLASLGHDVEEAELELDNEQLARDFFTMVAVEVAALVARAEAVLGRPAERHELQTSTAITALIGRQCSALAATRARDRLEAAGRAAVALHERFDLLLTPTLALPPFPTGALHPRGLEAFGQDLLVDLRLGFLLRIPGLVDESVRRVFSFIPYTPLANVTGQPAMSVPLFWNAAGLPIGAQLVARLGDEATLFQVASQLEEARPWKGRRPGVHADAR